MWLPTASRAWDGTSILRDGVRRRPALVQALARPDVRIEFVFCSITPKWAFTTAAAIAHCMKTIGPARFVISSDGGQAHNPMPAEGYRQFVQALHRCAGTTATSCCTADATRSPRRPEAARRAGSQGRGRWPSGG